MTARDVVFTFTFETWSDAVARGMARPPDRLALTLMHHPRVRRLVVANPPRNAVKRAARVTLRRDAAFPSGGQNWLASPVRLGPIDPTTVDGLQRQGAAYDGALRRTARRRGLESPVVITASPFAAGYTPFRWAGGTTYYARDDWSELPSREPWWPVIREGYRRIRSSGMPVVAVSQAIIDRIEPTGPALVVPNGVEPEEWAGPVPEPPDWFAAIPRPRALYVGTLDSRLDVEGLRVLARERPDLHIALLGVVGDRQAVAPLQDVPTIHLLPPTDRAGLVAAIRTSDLCLVSHVRTRLTAAMSPLKIYEYLAGGAPVLSVDLPPVRGMGERVLLADTTAGFVDRVDEALALGPQPESERLAFVDRNAWRRHHDDILDFAFGGAG